MKVVAWLIGIVSLILISAYSFTQEIRNYIFRDQLIIRTNGILVKSVQIKRVGELGSDTTFIFYEGKQQLYKVTQPGFNRFIVSVDNIERAQFEQFVNSDISKHNYVYELYRQQDSVFVSLRIFGPDQAK